MDELLEKIVDLKARGLIAGAISINFCQRATQPIKYRVHPSYEYSGLDDPTREVHGKVPNSEVIDRVVEFFKGHISNRDVPKAFSLKRPLPNPVRLSSALTSRTMYTCDVSK